MGSHENISPLHLDVLLRLWRVISGRLYKGGDAAIFSDRQGRFSDRRMLCEGPSSRIASKAIIVPLSLGSQRERKLQMDCLVQRT